MTEQRPPAEATVAMLTALALAVSWAVVAHTDAARADAAARAAPPVASRAAAQAAPAPGLVSVAAAPTPRRTVIVRRRSRAS